MDLFKNSKQYLNYKLIKQEHIPEIKFCSSTKNNVDQITNNAQVYELQHIDSSTKILYIENDDPEKSFSISFKTPPKDNTGVFHILEHSVLCGSRKFPVKEPFTNLLKSSMQTFLNAMTFDDKTMYPVATTNEKDLYNLIDVYMDAVFFPNIYKNINIFYQEGGHKTVEKKENKKYLGFNGVVYNEMKGVYSDPLSLMFDKAQARLYPNTCYKYSSGGIPDDIKKLKYKDFLEEHARHYRLDNAYIVLYGKLNLKKMLDFLDIKYLSKVNEIDKWREQGLKKCNFKKEYIPRNFKNGDSINLGHKKYKIESSSKNIVCACAYAIPRDFKKMVATKIVIDALAYSNESPLKCELLSKNVGSEVVIDICMDINQPYVIVYCKNANKNKGRNFDKIIKESLDKVLATNFEPAHLKAAVSHMEFVLKQNDTSYPKGIEAAINVMGQWLYDDKNSTIALKYINMLDWLKSQIKTDYFSNLAREVFISNKHMSSVEIIPEHKIYTKKFDEIDSGKAKEIEEICTTLKLQQEKPDDASDVAKIPVMNINDIEDINPYPEPLIETCSEMKCISYNLQTNGIVYANRYYNLNQIEFDDLPYIKIICLLLGKLDTTKYKSSEIDIISRDKIGSLSINTKIFDNYKDIKKPDVRLLISAEALRENTEYLTSFIDNILKETKFDNFNNIKTILEQKKISMEQFFIQNGHLAASFRASSKYIAASQIYEATNGIDFYWFLKDLLKSFESIKNKLQKKLEELTNKVFSTLPTVSFAGEPGDFRNYICKYNSSNNKKTKSILKLPKIKKANEAFIIPSNVNYAIMSSDMRLSNKFKPKGHDCVAAKIACYDYLWNEVRVKSGAYGSGLTLSPIGTVRYYSYRDPNNSATYEKYSECAKWLKKCPISQTDLENYIISCVSTIDSPKSVSDIISIQDGVIFCKSKYNKRGKYRKQVIKTNIDDIKNCGKMLETINKESVKCLFGPESIKNINKNSKDQFKIIDLFNN